ncbi:TPA: DUF2612 domain-containing protein [Escherichia coli]
MALNLDSLGLSAKVTAEGISAPDYQTILSTLISYFQQIYGSDAYLEPDSKDGQMVALVALAIHDANNTAISVYRSFSPSTALDDALTSNVKINGITRRAATNSTVDELIEGEAGTLITNGSVKDANGIIWNLPAQVTIGIDGTVIATATCSVAGAVAAPAGSVNKINTPTRGWVSVTNPQAATVGVAAETNAELRVRQSQSVALPSLTQFEAVDGAIANISGVTRHKLYENDTDTTDANGLPPHSIAAIVEGGDATVIANSIRGVKGQGVTPYGSTVIVVPDKYGNPHPVGFSRPVDVPIYVKITIEPLTGYTSQVGEEIKAAVSAYINSLAIGASVLLSRVYSPANLGVVSGGNARYYDITELLIGTSAGGVADVVGEWVGRSRRVATPVTGIYFSWDTERVGWDQGIWQGPYDPNDGFIDLSDEIYRLILKVKVAINNWDGQNDSLPSILDAALAGSGIRMAIVDNQDMSISIWILGDPSVALSEIDRLILDSAVNKGPFIALPAGYVPSRYDINPIDQVNSELWWAIQNGYMTVKAAGVRVREIETVSDGYQFFGFDIENDYIAGFDRGSWGERF